MRRSSELRVISSIIIASFTCALLLSVVISSFCSGVAYAADVKVAGALVIASGPEGYGTATTNASGQYEIREGLGTGNYTVSVTKEGYVTARSVNISVNVGSAVTQDMNLNLSGGFHGRVLTSSAPPVGLKDTVIMVTPFYGDVFHGFATITDAYGNYSVATNLPAGSYNITVTQPEGHVPKTTTMSAVAGIMLAVPDMILEASGTITGRVTDLSNNPLVNAAVTAVSSQYIGFAQTNETGHYAISSGLGRDSYNVTAFYEGHFSSPRSASITYVGQQINYVDLQIVLPPPQPTGSISGKVLDEDSNPMVGVHVTADGNSAGYGESVTDEEGNYVISGELGAGTYNVTAATVGYLPQTITGVAVTLDQTTSGINFALSKIPPEQSGSIVGTVTGAPDAIPEIPYPAVALVVASAAALTCAGLLKKKTKYRCASGSGRYENKTFNR